MKLIPYYDYDITGRDDPLAALHDLAKISVGEVVCRVRQTKDGVPFVCRESTLARLCLCDEQVSQLRFAEVDALMRLCNMRVMTLDTLFAEYARDCRSRRAWL